jgi:hypothetical protein
MSLTNPQNATIALPAYDIDKIVGIYEGSFDIVADTTLVTYSLSGFPYYVWYYEIDHSFSRPVFCELLTSTDGSTYVNNKSIAFSDSGKLYIYADANYTNSHSTSGTVYYKLIASWITGYDSLTPAITPVIQGTSGLYYSSVANQQKIYEQDVVTLANNTNTPVAHNLGYYPNAKVFMECFSGQVWPCHTGGTNDLFLVDDSMNTGYFKIGSSNITIYCDQNASSFGSSRFWYRVFIDD